jgi:hypothetical protein
VTRWALAAAILIGLTAAVQADSIPLTSVTYIDSGNTTSNYGGKTTFKDVLNGTGHYSGTVTRGLVAMPAVTIPAGEEIESVSLNLYCNQYSPPAGGSTTFSAALYPLTQSFVQGTANGISTSGATWFTYDGTHPWAAAGGDYDSSVSVLAAATPATGQWTSFDLTSIWNNTDLRTYGALLAVTPENPNLVSPSSSYVTESFASDGWVNTPDTNYHPYLSVTFAPLPVPEPSTLAMLVAGASLAAVGFGRRYRARRRRPDSVVPAE